MGAVVTIAAAHDTGPGTVTIGFKTPDGFEAEPDQFVKLSAEVDDESYARFYTLSPPGVDDTFEVTVGIDPEEAGPFNQHLDSFTAGGNVETSGPFGQDYHDNESYVVIFAGDPGVDPAIGITEAAVTDDNKVVVVYLNDAPVHEERPSAPHDDGTSVVVIGDESDLAGVVADALTGDEGRQLFVYGFADFVSRATNAVEAVDDGANATKVENFG